MGFLHQMGLGVQRNTDRAFELYQLAADAEDEQALCGCVLGWCSDGNQQSDGGL